MVRTVNHCYRNHSTSLPLSLTHTQCLSLSPWVQNTDLNHQQISAHSVKHQQHLKLRNYLDLVKKIYNKKKICRYFFLTLHQSVTQGPRNLPERSVLSRFYTWTHVTWWFSVSSRQHTDRSLWRWIFIPTFST